MSAILDDMLWMLLPLAALVAVAVGGSALSDTSFVLATVAMSVMMSVGIAGRAKVRRGMFLASCVVPESAWYWRLRGSFLIWLLAVLRAVPLATVLVVALARAEHPRTLSAFIVSAPLLVLLWHFWRARLRRHVQARVLQDVALRLAQAAVWAMLVIGLTFAALYATYPDLGDGSLGQAVRHEAARQDAASGLLLGLMQLAAAKDAVSWWLGQQFIHAIVDPAFRLTAWAIVLATDALVVWSYLVFCSSVLYLVRWRGFHPPTRDEAKP